MALTYTWNFPTLDIIYSEDGYQNVVQAVHWNYEANEGNFYENIAGCTPLPLPSGSFVNYNDLTPAIVTGWVEGALGAEKVNEMKLELANRLALKKNPKGESTTPPWE